jgi:CRISP-associated protein Cas1
LRDELDSGSTQAAEPDLVPARMVNEFVYCPRLAFLEWVQGEWDDNLDTIQGRWVHRRADVPSPREVPDAAADHGSLTARSLLLSAPKLGAIARIDVLELEGTSATPVEYKKAGAVATASTARQKSQRSAARNAKSRCPWKDTGIPTPQGRAAAHATV